MFSTATAHTSTQNTINTSAAGLVMRPRGRERNARREVYGHESAKYMNDLRPAHERSNTLLSLVGNSIDQTFKNAPPPRPTFNNARPQNVQGEPKQSFPSLGENRSTVKSNTWVTETSYTNNHMKTKDEYVLAPVPDSKRVKKMQFLDKSSINDAVDNLNFKEREKELHAEIDHWKRIAEERAVLLDEFEATIGKLNTELDNYLYDNY